jgi:hypothetical protein
VKSTDFTPNTSLQHIIRYVNQEEKKKGGVISCKTQRFQKCDFEIATKGNAMLCSKISNSSTQVKTGTPSITSIKTMTDSFQWQFQGHGQNSATTSRQA